jgi:hypothetical protein
MKDREREIEWCKGWFTNLQDKETSAPGVSREDALGPTLLAHVSFHPYLLRIELWSSRTGSDECTDLAVLFLPVVRGVSER